jgi:hypothetical protein
MSRETVSQLLAWRQLAAATAFSSCEVGSRVGSRAAKTTDDGGASTTNHSWKGGRPSTDRGQAVTQETNVKDQPMPMITTIDSRATRPRGFLPTRVIARTRTWRSPIGTSTRTSRRGIRNMASGLDPVRATLAEDRDASRPDVAQVAHQSRGGGLCGAQKRLPNRARSPGYRHGESPRAATRGCGRAARENVTITAITRTDS